MIFLDHEIDRRVLAVPTENVILTQLPHRRALVRMDRLLTD